MIIPDMRTTGKRTDLGAVVERLLTVTGGDNVSVGRKYKTSWQGKLGCRILVMSNDVPLLPDSSGAVASRFFPLEMTISFKGRDDLGLMKRLLAELPQIMNWAL
jgi:putative DNA primase/helicase